MIAAVVIVGCQKETDDEFDAIMYERQKVNEIAVSYLFLENNQYVLKLSREQAQSLGISQSDYERMLKEIEQTNTFIRESVAGNIDITLTDPQHIQISIIRLKNGVEDGNEEDTAVRFGSANMTSTGLSSGGSVSGFIPSGVTEIKITATTGCIVGVVSGTVSAAGGSTPFTIVGIGGGSTTVKLPASNTNVTVRGGTMCSNGGNFSVSYNR
jgi:hypothetical protein